LQTGYVDASTLFGFESLRAIPESLLHKQRRPLQDKANPC
jgi:hypothetical protein